MSDSFSYSAEGASTVLGQGRGLGVLVVGTPRHAEKIRRLLHRGTVDAVVESVDDYLQALGRVAVSAPSALIGPLEGLDEPTIEAVRQLAPNARLVLVCSADRQPEAEQALVNGCDDYLLEPLDAGASDRLARVFQTHLPQAEAESAWLMDNSRDIEDALDRGIEDAGGNEWEHHEASGPPEELHQDPAPPQPPDDSPTEQTDVGVTSARSGEGDLAVIDQVMAQKGMTRDEALRLIANRSGIAHVGWCETAEDVPASHVSVSVAHRGQNLGLLHAPPPAGDEQLLPWARWLGGWLAMDRYVGRLWQLAMHDDLTGLWNRRYFNRFLKAVLDRAAARRFYISLMVFDIDDFKKYNDRYGHAAGDQILCEAAKLIQSQVRQHDVVARIGGDEFAVIFWDPAGPRRPNSSHPLDPIKAAQRFRKAICTHRFPKLLHEAPGTLTISGGLAGFPWDGATPQQLLDRADMMALQSKQQGKNAITFGPGAQRHCDQMSL